MKMTEWKRGGKLMGYLSADGMAFVLGSCGAGNSMTMDCEIPTDPPASAEKPEQPPKAEWFDMSKARVWRCTNIIWVQISTTKTDGQTLGNSWCRAASVESCDKATKDLETGVVELTGPARLAVLKQFAEQTGTKIEGIWPEPMWETFMNPPHYGCELGLCLRCNFELDKSLEEKPKDPEKGVEELPDHQRYSAYGTVADIFRRAHTYDDANSIYVDTDALVDAVIALIDARIAKAGGGQ